MAQSVSIGEAQPAVGAGLLDASSIVPLGDVLIGRQPGRRSEGEITLFDGTGLGLQDLVVAAVAVQRARERGLGIEVGVQVPISSKKSDRSFRKLRRAPSRLCGEQDGR